MSEAKALEAKNLGNEALKNNKPLDAIKHFTDGVRVFVASRERGASSAVDATI